MLFNKIIGGSFLISNSILLAKNKRPAAECEGEGAEKGAADLDKIFAEAGGIPPDPEEIQELLMKAKGLTIR